MREICARLPPRVARIAARGDGARRRRVAKPNAEGDGPFDNTDAPYASVDFFEFAGSVRACLAFEELLGELEETLRRLTTDFDAARPMAREALLRAAETAAGGTEGGGGRDARAEAFLEAVGVALEAIPEAAVTFERFASELFVAMTPDADF